MAHAHPKAMLQGTLQTLTQKNLQPATGADLIKDWISALKSSDAPDHIGQQLQELYDELINPQPDASRVQHLLNKVAAQTESAALSLESATAEPVTQLANALRSFAADLGGPGTDAALQANQVGTETIYDMALTDDRIRTLFEQTQTLLTDGPTSTTPDAGIRLVEDWMSVVSTDVNTQWVAEPLAQLRDALTAGNSRQIERLMRDLAGQSQDLSDNGTEGQYRQSLNALASILVNFAKDVVK